MDKYKRLASNTILMAVSTFSSKVLSFLLTSYHTRIMGAGDYGTITIVNTIGNLLIPIVSLGISNAIIRYGLERGVAKKSVYTNGFLAVFLGFGVLLCLAPVLNQIPFIGGNVQGYWTLLLTFVFVSCLRTLNCQFVRARELMRLYAVDGILCTATNLGFNILFLSGFGLKPEGILLAMICSDGCSAVFLFFIAKLWRFLDFHVDFSLFKKMLLYSLPLISASLFWWVTNVSDQLFVKAYWGDGLNGIYVACYKLPSLLSIVATFFTEAWQLSAFTDGQEAGRDRFFTKVFSAYQSVMFLAAAGITLLCRPIMSIFVAKEYYSGWLYIPVLCAATAFSSLDNFLNSIYMLEKKSGHSLITMAVGAGLNILLNWAMIPRWGAMGASLATLASYLIVFLIRAVDTRRYVRIDFHALRLALNITILVLEALVLLYGLPLWPLWCSLLTALMLFLNFGALWETARHLLGRKKRV